MKPRSIAVTLLLVGGLVLALAGAFATIAGIVGDTEFELSFGEDYSLNTTSTGLVILAGGLLVIGIAAYIVNKSGVRPMSETRSQ
jgi:hypothetical protein